MDNFDDTFELANNNNYCFNCDTYMGNNNLSSSSTTQNNNSMHAPVTPKEETITSPNLDVNNEATRQSYLKATFIEALSYVFELHADHISQLQQLNLSQMKICPACDEHLTNVYQSRKSFLSLTAPNSRVISILTTKYCNDPTTEESEENMQMQMQNIPVKTELTEDDDNDAGCNLGLDDTFNNEEDEPMTDNDPLGTPDTTTTTTSPPKTIISAATGQTYLILPDTIIKKTKACWRCGKMFPLKRQRSWDNRPLHSEHAKVCVVANMSRYNINLYPKRAVTCSICGNPNVDSKWLSRHTYEHMGPEERRQATTCTKCGQEFPSLVTFIRHKKYHHAKPTEQKPPPPPGETTKGWVRRKPPKLTYTCPECGKSFYTSNPYALKEHMDLQHRHEAKHRCEICGKPFNNQYHIKLHKLSHLGPHEREGVVPIKEKSHLCAECGTSFTHASGLKTHIAIIHDKSQTRRKYTCEKCHDAVFCTKRTFERHLHGHEMEERGELYINCSYCPMKFKFRVELIEHKLSCEGQAASRPFECLVEGCVKRFKHKQVLEIHLNEYHKYGPEKARQMVYPGLPPTRKFQTKEYKKSLKLRRNKTRRKN